MMNTSVKLAASQRRYAHICRRQGCIAEFHSWMNQARKSIQWAKICKKEGWV